MDLSNLRLSWDCLNHGQNLSTSCIPHTAPTESQGIPFLCVPLGLTSRGEWSHAKHDDTLPYSNPTLLLHIDSLNMVESPVKSDQNFYLTRIDFTLVAMETIQYTGENMYTQTDFQTPYWELEHLFSTLTLIKLPSSKGRGEGRLQSHSIYGVIYGVNVTEPFSKILTCFRFLRHLQNIGSVYLGSLNFYFHTSEKKIAQTFT